MIQALIRRFSLYKETRFFLYLYLNHFCRSVVRTDNSRIIPYRNAVVDLEKNAKIILGGGDIEIGCDQLKGSREETRVRLRGGSVWSSYGGCRLSYGVTLEVLSGALLDTDFFTMNSCSVLVVAKRMTLGNDVMIARNVVLYDSDFHSILDLQGEVKNPAEPVMIGDHVWLGTNVTVLKGTQIGNGSIIGAGITVSGNVPASVVLRRDSIMENTGGWRRKAPDKGF